MREQYIEYRDGKTLLDLFRRFVRTRPRAQVAPRFVAR
jgi:hypothetical protein